MEPKSFLWGMLLVSLLAAGLNVGMMFLPWVAPFHWLGWLCMLFFVPFTLIMYYSLRKAVYSSNKNQFHNLVATFSMSKLFFCGGLLLAYFLKGEPESKGFAIPVLVMYLVFTAYEVYFMYSLSRIKG